jgi:hypothetical protein
MQTTNNVTTYQPHPRYVLIAAIAGAAVLALVWLLWRRLELGSVLFLLFAGGLLFFALRSLFSRVVVSDHALTLHRPLSAPANVQFRQLVEVSEEGRFQRVLLLLYHPLRADGLVDLDDLHSLALPALEEQPELLELLLGRVPGASHAAAQPLTPRPPHA